MKSNYLLIDKVRAPLAYTIKLAFTNRPAKRLQMHGFWREKKQNKTKQNKTLCSAATLAVLYGRTGFNNFTMPKAKTKGSKKRDGGSNGNLNGESAKETMLSEMGVSCIISTCNVYICWLFRMSAKCMRGTSA